MNTFVGSTDNGTFPKETAQAFQVWWIERLKTWLG